MYNERKSESFNLLETLLFELDPLKFQSLSVYRTALKITFALGIWVDVNGCLIPVFHLIYERSLYYKREECIYYHCDRRQDHFLC